MLCFTLFFSRYRKVLLPPLLVIRCKYILIYLIKQINYGIIRTYIQINYCSSSFRVAN